MENKISATQVIIGLAISVLLAVFAYVKITEPINQLEQLEIKLNRETPVIEVIIKTLDGKYLSEFIEIKC